MRTHSKILCLAVAAAAAAACKTSNDSSWIGAGVGTAVGAGAGYAIGGKKGALIGAAVGGLSGYIVGTELGASAPPEQKQSPEYNEARRLYDEGNRVISDDPMKAIHYYQESVRLAPQYPEPYNNMGLAYLKLGDRDQARQSFEKALAADPNYQPARDNLARMG